MTGTVLIGLVIIAARKTLSGGTWPRAKAVQEKKETVVELRVSSAYTEAAPAGLTIWTERLSVRLLINYVTEIIPKGFKNKFGVRSAQGETR